MNRQELTDFLRRMKETYEPTEKFHEFASKMIDPICEDDMPENRVPEFLERIEETYKRHSEQQKRMGKIRHFQSKLQGTTDPKKAAGYLGVIADTLGEACDSIEESFKRSIECVDEAVQNPYDRLKMYHSQGDEKKLDAVERLKKAHDTLVDAIKDYKIE